MTLPVVVPTRVSPEQAISVASWLLVVDRPRQRAVRGRLSALDGVQYRTTVGGHLVLVSESAPSDLDRVHESLRALPDVKDVALVSVFEDTGAA